MKSKARFLRNPHMPVIVVFGMLMILCGLVLYMNVDRMINDYVLRAVEKKAADMAMLYTHDLHLETQKLEVLSKVISNLDISGDSQDYDEMVRFIEENFGTDPDVLIGLLDAGGGVIYGERLPVEEYEGIHTSLRGDTAISFTYAGGILFSTPIMRGDNVRYVLYELCAARSYARRYPLEVYDGGGYAMVMTRNGEEVISFTGVLEEDRPFFSSDSVRDELKSLIRRLDLNPSAASLRVTTRGQMYFFCADVENTDFIIAGLEDRESTIGVLNALPGLVLLVFWALAATMMIMAIFLVSSARRAQESKELRAAKIQAEEASRAKSAFLASMSHEIRTPINAILGLDEMILRDYREPELRRYAGGIYSAAMTLLSLIGDILDFSRIEAGKLELEMVEYRLSDILKDLANVTMPRVEQKGLKFEINVNEEIPDLLYGDSIRIKQVVTNLLTNAVKYTHVGKVTMIVDFQQENKGSIDLTVSVKDTGIGIKEEDKARLFDAFERVDEKRNRTIEGAGLGLNIVKQLLGLMDSRLEVDSVYGEGSIFSFTITQTVMGEERIGSHEYINGEEISNVPEYHVTFTAEEASLLVVDDTEMNLMVIDGLLKKTKLNVDTASGGEQALMMSREKKYDVLLIDHRMPGMDGLELLKRLRSEKDNPNCNGICVALTANAASDARDKYIASGFDDYLAKPVKGSELEEALLRLLPKEKVHIVTEEEAAAEGQRAREEQEGKEEKNPVPEKVRTLEEQGLLNSKDGVEYAGSLAMYLMALTYFRDAIEKNMNELKELYSSENWEVYMTRVHALKSTSRIIGAEKLSDMARNQEMAAKVPDVDVIRAHHEELMEFYRKYLDYLEGI